MASTTNERKLSTTSSCDSSRAFPFPRALADALIVDERLRSLLVRERTLAEHSSSSFAKSGWIVR